MAVNAPACVPSVMCNVAALTFYATIYEDVRGARDERGGEHVPGTAQHCWNFLFGGGAEGGGAS